MKVFSFRNFRVLILLALLVTALIYTQEQERSTTSWYKPVEVIIFPINGDGHIETSLFIQRLNGENFHAIDDFFARNSEEYGLTASLPIQTTLGEEILELPPQAPHRPGILSAIWYSLKLRYWAYQETPDAISNQNRIRLFVLYHQPEKGRALAHSLGLQKGLIGVVNAFADDKQQQQNAVVMTHEILHTVGASDKYAADMLPLYPQGYAEPDRDPLYPQHYAEIMAGRVPITAHNAKMPSSLKMVKVGTETAREINWIP